MAPTTLKQIKFTLCFCRHRDNLLMLYRRKQPNQFKWNGLGDKIEANESPLDNIHREVLEESGLDLNAADSLKYAGIVTWNAQNLAWEEGGMHLFIAQLPVDQDFALNHGDLHEGRLDWKPLAWVMNPKNNRVVPNIRRFLPHAFTSTQPHEYQLTYRHRHIVKFTFSKL